MARHIVRMHKLRNKGSRSGSRKWLWWSLVILLAVGLYLLFKVFGPNTGSMMQGEYLYIRTGSDFEMVKQVLHEGGFIKDLRSFNVLAQRANYPRHIYPGKYHIRKGMSNYDLIRLLRSGRQIPVRLVINKLRTKDDFVRLVSNHLEADSGTLRQMLGDHAYLSQFGLDTNTALCAILPDTYEFYWNTNADKVFRKIEKNYVRFWTEERKAQAAIQGLSPREVVVLASIVEEETNRAEEQPLIAGVYLNRLKKGMKLQADPTARYAFGDFTIRRITAEHTGIVSPYNTYYAPGLPPGPICTPEAKTIQAVLDAPDTDYLYFCASGDGSGRHLFAVTYREHLENARAYHRVLNEQGIR